MTRVRAAGVSDGGTLFQVTMAVVAADYAMSSGRVKTVLKLETGLSCGERARKMVASAVAVVMQELGEEVRQEMNSREGKDRPKTLNAALVLNVIQRSYGLKGLLGGVHATVNGVTMPGAVPRNDAKAKARRSAVAAARRRKSAKEAEAPKKQLATVAARRAAQAPKTRKRAREEEEEEEDESSSDEEEE